MKILESRALRGPNYYSPYQTVYMRLDLEEFKDRDTKSLDGFGERLLQALPSLAEHRCSEGHAGGFLERMRDGTMLGHVVEHVAIELQCRAGMDVGFGKTRETQQPGVYTVVYRYRDEEAGLKAGEWAVELVQDVVAGRAPDVAGMLAALRRIRERNALGPSTDSIVRAARRRGIPVMRLDQASYLQLGYGARQRRVQATMTDDTRAIAVEVSDDKERTKQVLHAAGIPVPVGRSYEDLASARAGALALGFPVVVKPLIGNHGRGITTNVRTVEEFDTAYHRAQQVHRLVVVERHLVGSDFRVLLIGNRFVAACRRDPAHVVGDGVSTIQALVDRLNADPARGEDHERVLTKVRVDEATEELLRRQGLTLASVPASGLRVILKSTANLSSGGTAVDVTDTVHPWVRRMCERVSRIVGLDVMGVDIVAPTLERPFDARSGGIVEVNAAPGFRMHIQPSHGKPREVGAHVVQMLFPKESNGRIPIVAVTGTNGKTTTVRLIGHVLAANGAKVGLTTTGTVEIDGFVAAEGDYSGPDGARLVLQDPIVDHAVLEVARGGILRRGLGFQECDVGVFLNVSNDHLGEREIQTLEDLADLKAVVVESVRRSGTAVLNADDPLVRRYTHGLRAKVILFSHDPNNPWLAEHVRRGGMVITEDGTHVILRDVDGDFPVVGIREVPFTLEGRARFNVQNLMAAVAALHALGLTADAIRRGCMSFSATPEQLPGRLNFLQVGEAQVLVDYGHNVAAIQALGQLLRTLPAKRRLTVGSVSGNRRDEDITEFGHVLATLYDHIIVCDPDPRGRPLGQTAEMVTDAFRQSCPPTAMAEVYLDEDRAIQRGLELLEAGDLLVIQPDNVPRALELVRHEALRRSVPQRGPAPPEASAPSSRSLVEREMPSGAPAFQQAGSAPVAQEPPGMDPAVAALPAEGPMVGDR